MDLQVCRRILSIHFPRLIVRALGSMLWWLSSAGFSILIPSESLIVMMTYEDRSDPGSGFPSVAQAHAFRNQSVMKLKVHLK